MTNAEIYNIVTRIAVLVEGVKLGQYSLFASELARVKGEIRKLLISLLKDKKSIGLLTKIQLTNLLNEVYKLQSESLTGQRSSILGFLRDFCNTDATLNKRCFASYWLGQDCDAKRASKFFEKQKSIGVISPMLGWSAITPDSEYPFLWSKITNAPMPANGMTITAFLSAFATSALAAVQNSLRASWANNDATQDAIDAIVGIDGGQPGVLDRVGAQADAVIATTTQHVAQQTSAAVVSALMEQYRWDSIIDGRTTDICRSRNNHIYTYGTGPIPPAHIRCRSHTTPILPDGGDSGNQTFYNWASNQPASFLNAVFDSKAADSLANGTAKKSDFDKFTATKPITVAQFADSISLVL